MTMPLTDNPEREYSKVALMEEYEDCIVPKVVFFGADEEHTYVSDPKPQLISLDGDPLNWPLLERPVIYVAGYYSANPTHGAANAIKAFDALLEAGWLPYVPHASLIVDMLSPRTPDFWYGYDLGLLARCDAMYVCPDLLTAQSIGVHKEVVYARTHDIPIFYTIIQAKDRYAE